MKRRIKRLAVNILFIAVSHLSYPRPAAVLPNEIREKFEFLTAHYVHTLEYLTVPQKPFLICFSGTSGMGKSYLAALLQDRYKAIRLRTDDLRALLGDTNIPENKVDARAVPADQLDPNLGCSLIHAYILHFLECNPTPNKFVILDGSVDRFPALFPYLESKKLPYVVIRLEVTKEKVIERIIKRNHRVQFCIHNLEKWFEDYAKFKEHCRENCFVFYNDDNACLEELLSFIDTRVKDIDQ